MAAVDLSAETEVAVDVGIPADSPDVFRLMSLPPGVLWHVVRKMGRRSRTLSRAVLHAYGPLDCGLKSDDADAAAQLQQLLAGGSAERLRHVTALQLGGENDAGVFCPDWHALIPATCRALPSLRSLQLITPWTPLAGPHLALLAPLCPTLTSLAVSVMPVGTYLALQELRRLSNLRSLTLRGDPDMSRVEDPGPALRRGLGRLPHLAHLSWFARSTWSPQCLAALGSHVPHLTSLSLGSMYCDHSTWDAGAAAAVLRLLPRLRTLSFKAEADGMTEASIDALIAGLARHGGVGAVHLDLKMQDWDDPPDLGALAGLPLAGLTAFLCNVDTPARVEPLMRALQAQSGLATLSLVWLSPGGCKLGSSYMHYLPSSLVDLRVAGNWDPAALIRGVVQRLPRVRALHLSPPHEAQWDYAATVELLPTLTQLHSISMDVPESLAGGLLAHISGLTALRELQLMVYTPAAGRPFAGETRGDHFTDDGLLQLVSLREQLTCLRFRALLHVTAPGLAALLSELTNLRELELLACEIFCDEAAGGVWVHALLPFLSSLSSLKLARMPMPVNVRATLKSAAQARGCAVTLK